MTDTKEMRAAFEVDFRERYSIPDTIPLSGCGGVECEWRGFQAAWTRKPAEQVAGVEVDDLAMLIRQLVRALSKASPNSPLIARTMGYLNRKGLQGSPLRAIDQMAQVMRDAAVGGTGIYRIDPAEILAHPAPEPVGVPDDEIRRILRKAFNYGQTYWQQADSESYRQQDKSPETAAKFAAFVEETVAALAAERGWVK